MYSEEKKYWNGRYEAGHTSGYGSYGEQLTKKLNWLRGLDVDSISEIGCGDLNFAKNLLKQYPFSSYNGQDISEFIIEKNKKENPRLNFVNEVDNLPISDLLLCVDVLFHITEDSEVEALLKQIESKWSKYLAITAYERDQEMEGHVRIRKFDYKRFGEPVIREIVEEDGQLYFYLFKKEDDSSKQLGVNLREVSACLITKENEYPKEILEEIYKYPFGEVLILDQSDSPYNKHKLFQLAKFPHIYYQDDDAIVPIDQLVKLSDPDKINVAMKEGHFKAYENTRMTMGLGWGAIFPKKVLSSLHLYTDVYGKDDLFKRETERILTYLNFPQNRLVLPIVDLPSAWAEDRLWRQPGHNENIAIVEERCSKLVL